MEQLRPKCIEPPVGDAAPYRVRRQVPPVGVPGTEGFDLVVELIHDLRSPLTAIMAISEQMLQLDFGEVSDLQRRQLSVIYSAALRLNALTTDVMELAEGDGQWPVQCEPFSIGEVIRAVSDMVEPIAVGKGIELRTAFPEEELRWGHRSQLSRILLNLATNALNFTDEGHVEIVATPSTDGRIPFSVRDTGRGILPGALEPHIQRHGPSRELGEFPVSERGMGLTMCRGLLRAMGSELEVETRPGWGTRFHFALDLPLLDGAPQPPRAVPSALRI